MPWAFLLFPCGRFPLGKGEGLPAGWSSPLRCGRFGKGAAGWRPLPAGKTKWCERRQSFCPLRGSAGNGGSSSARAPAFVRTRPALGWRFCGALSQRAPGKNMPTICSPCWQPAEKVIGSRTMWRGCCPPQSIPKGCSANAAGPAACKNPRPGGKPPAQCWRTLQDPGNLGTILRTAEALGVSQVCLLGECCDPLSPKALRASMGAVFRLSLWEEPQRERLCSQLPGGRIHPAGLCAGEGRLPRDRGGACPGEICGIYWK